MIFFIVEAKNKIKSGLHKISLAVDYDGLLPALGLAGFSKIKTNIAGYHYKPPKFYRRLYSEINATEEKAILTLL